MNDNDFFDQVDSQGSDGSFQLQFSPSQRAVRSINASILPENHGAEKIFHSSFQLSKQFQTMFFQELQEQEVNPPEPTRSSNKPDEVKKQSSLRKLFNRQVSLKFLNKETDTNRSIVTDAAFFSIGRRWSLKLVESAPEKQPDHSSLIGNCPFESEVVEAFNASVVSGMSENSQSSDDSAYNNNYNSSTMSIKWLSDDSGIEGSRSFVGLCDESFSSTQSWGSTAVPKPRRRSSSRSRETPTRGTTDRRSSNLIIRRSSSRRRSKKFQRPDPESESKQVKTDDNNLSKPPLTTSAEDVYVSKSRAESSSKDRVRRSKSESSLPDEGCKSSEHPQKDKDHHVQRTSIKSESRLQQSWSSKDKDSNMRNAKQRKRRTSTTIRRFSVADSNEDISNEGVIDDIPLEYPTLLHQIVIVDLWLPNPNMIELRLQQFNGVLRGANDPSSATAIPSDSIVDRIGVSSPVVGAMRKWATNCGIQREACRLIHVLVNRESIALSFHECGAMKAILVAMKTFSSDEAIQAGGCGALYALTCLNNAVLSTSLVDQDGLSKIAAAMKAFPSSDKIQQRGALVFCCVAQFNELRPALKIGTKLVRNALQRYPSLDDEKSVCQIREPKPDDNPSVSVVAPGA